MKLLPLIGDLRQVKTLVTHAGCADGIMSAILIKNALPDVEVLFMHHTSEEHRNLIPKPGMMFCDFVPHPARYKEFVAAGAFCLDHHKSAKYIVDAFGDRGVFADEDTDPGVSGAVLAYREVWQLLAPINVANSVSENAYELSTLVGIRDTWQKGSPRWEDACVLSEALKFYPIKDLMDGVDSTFCTPFVSTWQNRMHVGVIVRDKHNSSAHRAVSEAYRKELTVDGKPLRVVIFSGVGLTSDAAEYIGKEADVVVAFDFVGIDKETGMAKLVYSLRSKTDFNCAAFADKMGGGGHVRAAGFTMLVSPGNSFANPYAIILNALETV